MNFKVSQVEKYGVLVFQHAEMDALRRSQCLCLNCAKMKPGKPEHCPIAQAGFELCKTFHVAYAMTRCPEFESKRDEEQSPSG